jgi:hypothetical protein
MLLICINFVAKYIAKIAKMLITLLYTLLIIAISMVLLSIRVLIKKRDSFKSQHIHDNEYLKKKGIHCVLDQDKEARHTNRAF